MRLATIAWDRGLVFMDLETFGPLHEIEAINRWRLPQWLARMGLAPVARFLRHRRVRSWWRRDGTPDAVVVLGRIRPEMTHYVPPGSGPVTLLIGWRDGEGAESLEATLALADRTLADDTTADEIRAADPDAPVLSLPALVAALGGRAGAADRRSTAPLLVTGIGPGDWRGAPELFLRVAAALPASIGGRSVGFAWLGLDPEDGRSFPYLYDQHHLGLDGRVEWIVGPEARLAALGASTAVVLTGRAACDLPVHSFVDVVGAPTFLGALGLPILAFATPAAEPLAAARPTLVAYPDVAAMTAALAACLVEPATADLAGVVGTLGDLVLGSER